MSGRIADNVIRINTKLDATFFRYWLEFLRPFHGLTPREMDVTTSFLYERYKLSKVINDETILNQVVMSNETKKKIQEDCNISNSFFLVILYNLKKSNIIVDGKINPRFIPNIIEENGAFKLMIYFDFKDE